MSQELFVQAAAFAQVPHAPSYLVRIANESSEGRPHTVGTCLQALSDEELDLLMGFAGLCLTESGPRLALTLFVVLLANNEGLPVYEHTLVSDLARRFLLMAQAESLFRQGLVTLDHASLTLEAFDAKSLKLTAEGAKNFKSVSTYVVSPKNTGKPDGSA